MCKYLRLIVIFAVIFLISAGFCAAFTLEDEINLGREVAREVEKEVGVTYKREYVARLQKIVSHLYRVAPRKEIPYEFKVLDTDVFNACACPGGFIFINRGVMESCTDGELAYIVSHEMAHCAHSHSFNQMKKTKLLDFGAKFATIFLSKDKKTDIAINLTHKVLTTKFSRSDEKQSDMDAISYMHGAGYNPAGAVSALEKMKKMGEPMPRFLNTMMGSHPPTVDRIDYVKDLIGKKYEWKEDAPNALKNLEKQRQDEVDNIINNMEISLPSVDVEVPKPKEEKPQKLENKKKKK